MAGRQTAPAGPQTPTLAEGSREGNRWINARPSGEDVAAWFAQAVRVHDGLDHAHYVGGITLIGGSERLKQAQVAGNGQTVLVDVERYVWTPYIKVETRVRYFWDMIELDDDIVGAIEPVEHARLGDAGVYNRNLPPGFFRLPVALGPNEFVHFIGCTMRVVTYRANTLEWATRVRKIYDSQIVEGTPRQVQVDEIIEDYLRGIPVAMYPPATKQIASVSKNEEADPFAVMKAETGAVGRALGMAGVLVLPGSGIATAEDMHEAIDGARGGTVKGAPEPPPVAEQADPAKVEADTRERIQGKIATLQSVSQEGYDRLAAWAGEKKIDLSDPRDTQLRGLELQLDRLLPKE